MRYVGWTINVVRRLKHHLYYARTARDRTRCGRWKQSLLQAGVSPVLRVVESGVEGDGKDAEVRWVAHFRALVGDRLTNLTDGGDGTAGHTVSPEARAKISAARKGRKATPEARANMRAAHLGVPLPRAQVEKISAANRGRVQPPEERAKRSKPRAPEAVAKSAAAKRGVKRSDKSRAKMRASHLGVPLSAEHKASLSAALRRKYEDPEIRAKYAAAAAKGRAAQAAKRRGIVPEKE